MKRSARTLRIIGGEWRRRLVSFPDLPAIRPTPDRVRETLFNWLATEVPGAHCLDLFAGSGILSLEALSRGAAQATIIDQSAAVIEHIGRQLAALGVPAQRYRLHCADALDWLRRHAATAAFDLVFLDPPFDQRLLAPACDLILKARLLAPGGLVYLESDQDWQPEGWVLHRKQRAGKVYHFLYHPAAVPATPE